MESKSGAIKWLVGTGVLVMIIFGIYVEMQSQKVDMSLDKHEFNKASLRFDRDFTESEADFTDNKKRAKQLLERAKDYDYEIEAIRLKEREAEIKKKELNKKSDKVLNSLEREFDKFDDEDSFFK